GSGADGVRTVLYAPTWIGPYADTDVYSLPVGADLVRALLARGVRVVFRAHPLNYTKPVGTELVEEIQAILAEDAAATGRAHLWGEAAEIDLTVEECFNLSDAMVCDVSAVVSDYLQSGKPMAIMAMGHDPAEILDLVPAARAAYVIPRSLDGLEERLDELLETDPLAAERVEMRRYYLGDFPADSYAEGFLEAARRHVDEPPRAH
ncbi:MAG: CDP-glycerol glycerophosphotransferase family protein, partial [Actinomycetota bacterium]|nr:CDP-glycerol glycerophosphotransferase family protein [Actinomycetota bacterium]